MRKDGPAEPQEGSQSLGLPPAFLLPRPGGQEKREAIWNSGGSCPQRLKAEVPFWEVWPDTPFQYRPTPPHQVCGLCLFGLIFCLPDRQMLPEQWAWRVQGRIGSCLPSPVPWGGPGAPRERGTGSAPPLSSFSPCPGAACRSVARAVVLNPFLSSHLSGPGSQRGCAAPAVPCQGSGPGGTGVSAEGALGHFLPLRAPEWG